MQNRTLLGQRVAKYTTDDRDMATGRDSITCIDFMGGSMYECFIVLYGHAGICLFSGV